MKICKEHEAIIIEDVIWYDIKDGVYQNSAKDTFYYQFLMENANKAIGGQENRQAATDFFNYEELYIALLNKGILQKYCLDYSEIYGGATFSFNLTEALKECDVEHVLKTAFPDAHMDKYIQSFLHPADGFKCSVCGAVTLSRHITFRDSKDAKRTYCIACYPLDEAQHKALSKFHAENNIVETVKKRNQIISDMAIIKIAEGLTPNILLDRFIKDQESAITTVNPKISVIQQILEEAGRTEFEVFQPDDDGIVIWDRRKLANLETFYDTVVLSSDGTEIVLLYNRAAVCFLDDDAIRFASCLTTDEKLLKALKEV